MKITICDFCKSKEKVEENIQLTTIIVEERPEKSELKNFNYDICESCKQKIIHKGFVPKYSKIDLVGLFLCNFKFD